MIYFIITATFVFFWFAIRKEKERQTRKNENLCRVCGYDLRASQDRCPECGSPIIADQSIQEGDLNLAALAHDWPATEIKPRDIIFGEPTTSLLETSNRTTADLLAQQLTARGVSAAITEKINFQQMGYISESRPSFKVLVAQDDLVTAQGIVARFRRVPGAQ